MGDSETATSVTFGISSHSTNKGEEADHAFCIVAPKDRAETLHRHVSCFREESSAPKPLSPGSQSTNFTMSTPQDLIRKESSVYNKRREGNVTLSLENGVENDTSLEMTETCSTLGSDRLGRSKVYSNMVQKTAASEKAENGTIVITSANATDGRVAASLEKNTFSSSNSTEKETNTGVERVEHEVKELSFREVTETKTVSFTHRDSQIEISSDNDNISTASVNKTCHSLDESSGCWELFENAIDCSVTTSPSSCEEDPDTFIRMDAMNDSSGTSSDSADDTSPCRDSSCEQSVSKPYHPSPDSVFAIPQPKSDTKFLATSTPKLVFYPQYRMEKQCSRVTKELSPDDYNKIKRLAASMPSTREEQERIMPIISGFSNQCNKDYLMVPRSNNYILSSPQSSYAEPSSKTSSVPSISRLQNKPNTDTSSDLSEHLVRDIAQRKLLIPPIDSNQMHIKQFGGFLHDWQPFNGSSSREQRHSGLGSRSRCRLDQFFQDSPTNTDLQKCRSASSEQRMQSSNKSHSAKVRFRTETEEAVHYLITKYLEMPVL